MNSEPYRKGGKVMNNKIREIINSRHLKISKVIDNLNVAKSYFYDVMNGRTVPSLTMARKFSNELEVPLDELFPEQKFDS
jgi:transcriptional regulator with XRE-family HTH domain